MRNEDEADERSRFEDDKAGAEVKDQGDVGVWSKKPAHSAKTMFRFATLEALRHKRMCIPCEGEHRESNPGPLAPEARILPLDHVPDRYGRKI